VCAGCLESLRVLQITTTSAGEEELKAETEQLEVILGQQMQHPNVVMTLASGTRKVTVRRCSSYISWNSLTAIRDGGRGKVRQGSQFLSI